MKTTEPAIKVNGDEFILVEAESLSLDDEFMKYEPQTKLEKVTKERISEAISKGVKNFYRPTRNLYYTAGRNGICFTPGNELATRESYKWWEYATKNYCPERNSRLGTRLEYFAFLGVIIKKLVEEGKSVEWVWNMICDDSIELPFDKLPKTAEDCPEYTGSIEICGFVGFGNNHHVLAKDIEAGCFWLAGGGYSIYGSFFPPANLYAYSRDFGGLGYCVAWLVLS